MCNAAFYQTGLFDLFSSLVERGLPNFPNLPDAFARPDCFYFSPNLLKSALKCSPVERGLPVNPTNSQWPIAGGYAGCRFLHQQPYVSSPCFRDQLFLELIILVCILHSLWDLLGTDYLRFCSLGLSFNPTLGMLQHEMCCYLYRHVSMCCVHGQDNMNGMCCYLYQNIPIRCAGCRPKWNVLLFLSTRFGTLCGRVWVWVCLAEQNLTSCYSFQQVSTLFNTRQHF